MKTVGLLSGGKDSVYNLLHCIANGHEPVALASLGPGAGKDEIDSYMYQTVGHSGLASIAEALQLPLFTHTIAGSAVNLGGEYGSREAGTKGTEGDETEDLYDLLKKVKDAMPEVEAVACGAILSNYQRVRVEHVCSRLKLTPIAYLWERNQTELLNEMVGAGMESVLVKVAGAGLGVEHLGKSLKEMEPTLLRLNSKFQLHVCGEGGEYETFTLDCPIFQKRLELTKTTTVVSNPDPLSTIAHLHLDACTLIPKPSYPLNETWPEKQERIRSLLGIPSLLDEDNEVDAIRAAYELESLPVELRQTAVVSTDLEVPSSARISRLGDWIAFAEVTAFGAGSKASVLSLEDEVKGCFANLEALLATHSATLLSLAHLTLYLSPTSMSLFPTINAIYSTYFGSSPPTRACVSILLSPPSSPTPLRLKLEGLARVGTDPRTSLHVQSLSYWAAANIGPYSQGIATGDRLSIAGQIALIPSSLTLPSPPDFVTEVALSRQHVARVVAAADDGRWRGKGEGGEAFGEVVYVSAATLPKGASVEWQVTCKREQEEVDSEDEDAKATPPSKPIGIITIRAGKMASVPIVTSPVLLVRAFHHPSVSVAEITRLTRDFLGIPSGELPALSTIGATFIATQDESDVDVAFLLMGE
ncbi:hypothetical protein RQP46_002418 [Phenoliferia psychrophenolica]